MDSSVRFCVWRNQWLKIAFPQVDKRGKRKKKWKTNFYPVGNELNFSADKIKIKSRYFYFIIILCFSKEKKKQSKFYERDGNGRDGNTLRRNAIVLRMGADSRYGRNWRLCMGLCFSVYSLSSFHWKQRRGNLHSLSSLIVLRWRQDFQLFSFQEEEEKKRVK